jgi:hypothetical protein
MSSTVWRSAAGSVALGFAVVASGPAIAPAHELAAPTPSPTLGSTNSPAPEPPGSADSSPSDYDNAAWVVVGAGIVVVLVAGGTVFLMRTRRIDLAQRSAPSEEEQHQK